jgi:hypothetical protein
MRIDSVDEIGLINVSKGDLQFNVSLDNVRKNYERDKNIVHVSDLVQTLLLSDDEIPSTWQSAKLSVYIQLDAYNHNEEAFVFTNVSEEFGKGYVYGTDKLICITNNDLQKWGITKAELDLQARLNADRLLAQTEITVSIVQNCKLGVINSNTALKGALLFAPSMKEKIREHFGYPFYAVIPVRDFCYIFSENDFDFFASRIGPVVVREFIQSGYPITTEILKFDDNGVKAVGKYPVN